MPRIFIRTLLSLLAGLSFSVTAWAHKASDAYLQITQASAIAPAQLHYVVALRDLDALLDTLDANNDRALSYGEVKAALPQIQTVVNQGVALRCAGTDSPAALNWSFEALEQRSDGAFARLAAQAPAGCDAAQAQLRYTLMQGSDADHRAILSLHSAQQQSSRVLTPAASWVDARASDGSTWATLVSFITLGMEHIGSGADHIAFVICLVLGIALREHWRSLLITITAFTLGHSITLIAATLGWIGSPGWVEPAIAASIAVAAAINLLPQRTQRYAWLQSLWLKALIACGFGLVHGLGFSGAMTEAQVPANVLLWALAGFNIGVELGQLLIIGLWALLYAALHRWAGYKRWVLQGGSVAMVLLSMYWLVQRAQLA